MRRTVKTLVLALVASAVLFVSFSQEAADWWGEKPSSDHGVASVEGVRSTGRRLIGEGIFAGGLLVHVALWSALTLAVLWMLPASRSRRATLVAASSIAAAGLLVEVGQEVFTLRNAEFGDLAGNLLGIGGALLLTGFVRQLRAGGLSRAAESSQ